MDKIALAVDNFKTNEIFKYNKVFKIAEEKRLKFLELFPKERILDIELDEYVVGKGDKNSFCYWLETELRDLGSIKGGSTADKKFGVYYSKKTNSYITIKKWDQELKVEKSFNKIKIEIYELICAGEKSDLESIAQNKLSPMFKNKILTTYYPTNFLNISSIDHVDYYINKLGIVSGNDNIEYKRQDIIDFKNNSAELNFMSNYMFSAFLYHWSKPRFNEIRLLPMSSKLEFSSMSYIEVQNKYLLEELIFEQNGEYLFREKGINAPKNTLVLFQFKNKIIGSAKLINVVSFKELKDNIYGGAYYFDTDSIEIFEPIVADEISKIDNTFKKFSQVKKRLDISKQDLILDLINSKQEIILPEEVSKQDSNKLVEGSKKQIIVNAYERNVKARTHCIKIYGAKCAICGFDFGQFYGNEFEGKIHVHHKVALNEIQDEYEVDPEQDLIPVCPNCHLVLHAKSGGTYTIDEVKSFIDGSKNN